MFLQNFLEQILILFHSYTGSYGTSIVLLSFVITLFLVPLFWMINRLQIKEKKSRAIIQPELDKIKNIKNGQEKFYYTKEIYKKNNYNPYYSLLGVFGVAVQIPFLLAAYWLLSDYVPLQGVAFGPIENLFLADGLIEFKGFSINVLPILMTIINLLSIYINRNNMRKNEKIQLIIIACVFLIFFYDLSSALVLYWTFNNVFSFVKNWILVVYNKRYNLPELQNESLRVFVKEQFNKKKKDIITLLFSLGLYFSLISLVYKSIFGYSMTTFFSLTFSLVFFNLLLFIFLFKLYKDNKKRNLKKIGALILFVEVIVLLNAFSGIFITFSKYYSILFVILIIAIYLVYSFYAIKSTDIIKQKIFSLRDLGSMVLLLSFPLIVYVHSNFGYFNIFSSVLFFLLLIGTPLILFLVFSLILQTKIKADKIYIIIISLFFTLYVLPILTNLFELTAETNILIHLLFLLTISGFLFYIFQKSRKMFFFMSLMIFTVSFLQIFISQNENKIEKEIGDYEKQRKGTELYQYLSEKEMKAKPDIYFLVYDSYVNEKQMNSYGIDNSEQMNYLKENKFQLYNNTYSIGPNTTVSMPYVFQIDEFEIDEKLCNNIIGNSTVDDILQLNGYETNYVLNPFFFRCSDVPFGGDFINNKSLLEFSGEVNGNSGMVSILYSIIMGEFKFNNEFMIDELNYNQSERIVDKVIKKKTSKPKFVYHHSMTPGHSQDSGECLPNEIELYKSRVAEANKLIKKDVANILETNKDAIIIIAGDHGPSLTFGCENVIRDVSKEQIDSKVIADRVGVFLAIRYPESFEKKINTDEYNVLQNTFVNVFEKLYEDENIQNFKMTTEILYGGLLRGSVKDGKILLGKDKGKMLFENHK